MRNQKTNQTTRIFMDTEASTQNAQLPTKPEALIEHLATMLKYSSLWPSKLGNYEHVDGEVYRTLSIFQNGTVLYWTIQSMENVDEYKRRPDRFQLHPPLVSPLVAKIDRHTLKTMKVLSVFDTSVWKMIDADEKVHINEADLAKAAKDVYEWFE